MSRWIPTPEEIDALEADRRARRGRRGRVVEVVSGHTHALYRAEDLARKTGKPHSIRVLPKIHPDDPDVGAAGSHYYIMEDR